MTRRGPGAQPGGGERAARRQPVDGGTDPGVAGGVAGGPVVPAPRAAPGDVPPRGDVAAVRGVPVGRDGGCGLAWLVRPVTHVPGVLHLREGRLRFVSTRGVIFDDTPDALAVAAARTSRGGFRITVGGERLRLHVVRFDGATEIAADLRDREAPAGLLTTGEPAAGPVWRGMLAAHPAGSAAASVDSSGARRPVGGGRHASRAVRARGWRPVRARRACATPERWY